MEEAKLKKLITEARELAKALDKFADELEKTGKMQAVHSAAKNGFPHFMTELTEDEFDESEGDK